MGAEPFGERRESPFTEVLVSSLDGTEEDADPDVVPVVGSASVGLLLLALTAFDGSEDEIALCR